MKRILTYALAAGIVCALVMTAAVASGELGIPTWSINKSVAYSGQHETSYFDTWDGDVDGMNKAAYVWLPGDATTGTVVAYDLSTDESQTVMAEGLTEDQDFAEITDDVMIVSEQRDGDWGLYKYELNTEPLFSELITATAGPTDPDMDFSTFAYAGVPGGAFVKGEPYTPPAPGEPPKESKVEDYAVGTRIIYGFSGDSDTLEVLPGIDGAAQFQPSLSGNYVAYQEIDSNTAPETVRIKVQSLSDPDDVTVVASGTAVVESPSLDDDLVAWMEWVSDHWEVRAYDLSADEEIDVDNEGIHASSVDVDGTKIYAAWLGDGDIVAAYDTQLDDWTELDWATRVRGLSAKTGQLLYSFRDAGVGTGINDAHIAEPVIYMETPPYVSYNAMPFISGWVADQGIGLGVGEVQLQSSTDNIRWTTEDTATPDADGDYFLNGDPLTEVKNYRVRYLGSQFGAWPYYPQHLSAVSQTDFVVSKPKLGTPSAPKSIKVYQRFTSSGTVSPEQVDVEAAGAFEVEKYNGGKWRKVSEKTVAFKSNGTYEASLKFGSSGKWRWRLHFLGSNINYPNYSNYRTVTVK